MVSVGSEGELLQKIIGLITQLRAKLSDIGLSRKQILIFFSVRIFQGSGSSHNTIDVNEALNRQIMSLIWKAKESSTSVKSVLIDILNKLEIENGFIEEYEQYEPETLPLLKLDKRKSS